MTDRGTDMGLQVILKAHCILNFPVTKQSQVYQKFGDDFISLCKIH
jgi:hypothetical protein